MSIANVIAIDGPPASGKTTVGRALAQRLGYHFLDTGLLYRALTWWLLQKETDLNDLDSIARDAVKADLTLHPTKEASWSTCVQGRKLGDAELRSPKVEKAVPLVSAVPAVREYLRGLQRELAADGKVIMAGQDIGSVVLPDAPIKVFLEASLGERVRRRSLQSDNPANIQTTLARRSEQDAARAASPLAPAPDAHLIDTERLTADQVVDKIVTLMHQTDP